MGIKELQAAISETYVAASKIASVEHVLALESKLRSSLVEFTLTADNEFERSYLGQLPECSMERGAL